MAGSVMAFASESGVPDAERPAPEVSSLALQPSPARPQPGSSQAHGSAGPAALSDVVTGFDPLRHELQDGRLVSPLPRGRTADLTLSAPLQAHLEKIFTRYKVPYGAAVAIEPDSGRVLAYVSHSSQNPKAGDLVLDPTPPAASVFKVITSAALLDDGVRPDQKICYSGGFRSIYMRDLEDDPRRDSACVDLAGALGRSVNTVFAKLADRRLSPATLRRYAEAFGFGHALPFDVRTKASPSEVPKDRLEFARTAAGFWHMHMSPLHAALIGATVANGGVMPRPHMVSRVRDAQGQVVAERKPEDFRSVIPASTAKVLGHMMGNTVTSGTARGAFFDDHGLAFLPGVQVAGKTGSLSTSSPYRAYSWWVGFAPIDKPKIAVAALVVNDPKWRIKGSYVAREALRKYLLE